MSMIKRNIRADLKQGFITKYPDCTRGFLIWLFTKLLNLVTFDFLIELSKLSNMSISANVMLRDWTAHHGVERSSTSASFMYLCPGQC